MKTQPSYAGGSVLMWGWDFLFVSSLFPSNFHYSHFKCPEFSSPTTLSLALAQYTWLGGENRVLFMLLLLFSRQVMPDSLWPHGLQHVISLYPSLSPRVCPSSRPLKQWCHPTIFCHPLLLLSWILPSIRSFPVSQFFPQVTKVLEFQLWHQSFQWLFRVFYIMDNNFLYTRHGSKH